MKKNTSIKMKKKLATLKDELKKYVIYNLINLVTGSARFIPARLPTPLPTQPVQYLANFLAV